MDFNNPRDNYIKKRWEGKPLPFKIRFLIANYPGIAIGVFGLAVLLPIAGAVRICTYEGSRNQTVYKYRHTYQVVRDDDPNVDKIICQKEKGRDVFP